MTKQGISHKASAMETGWRQEMNPLGHEVVWVSRMIWVFNKKKIFGQTPLLHS